MVDLELARLCVGKIVGKIVGLKNTPRMTQEKNIETKVVFIISDCGVFLLLSSFQDIRLETMSKPVFFNTAHSD